MGDSSDGQQDTLDYIHSMLGQLRSMAEVAQYSMLAYLIEMACVEAGEMRSGPPTRPGQTSRSGPDKRDGAA